MHIAEIFEPMSDSPEAVQTANSAAAEDSGLLAFPASVSQQVFWYMELLQGEVTAFNVPLRFQLDGVLDAALLERALNTVIERHEALRTRFCEDRGELLQIVAPALRLKLDIIDISHLPADRMDEEAARLGTVEACRPFRLSTGPLIRAELVRLAKDSHILHVTAHHALFDGISMGVLTDEITASYQAFFEGKPCPLPPLAIQYGDFSVWQKQFLEGPEMAAKLAFWKKRLEGMVELDLPTDFPRPPVKTWRGDIISTLLPTHLTDKLQAIAAKRGATLFHLQLAAFNILLHRYCETTDIAIGTPVTGRTRPEVDPLIGVFINSLILRNDVSGNPTFGRLIEKVRDNALEALENQDLPFEYLVRELKPERDQSRNPLFQVNFNHHPSFVRQSKFGGVTLTSIPSRCPGTIFDLHFFLVEREEGWRLACDYSTDLFTRGWAERMLGHFKRLLEDIASRPEQPIAELEILTDSEKSQLLGEWSGITNDYPRDATIGALFVETARRYPSHNAISSGTRKIRYDELHSAAVEIAAKLIKRGVSPGQRIALCSYPCPEMIAGMVGILLAGACCVPMDANYPADRFAMLLEESGSEIALATGACDKFFPTDWKGEVVMIEIIGEARIPADLPEVLVAATDAAHLLFTSGSTGRPKGILLAHRGVVRLVRNSDFISINSDDVFLQAAPVSFDASLLEIWGPLLNGGRLVMLPANPGLGDIAATVRDEGVTTLWLTSGLFQLMVDEHPESLTGLRYLLAGGDVLSMQHIQKALSLFPNTTLINGYGPTENTTFTTCHTITQEDLAKPSVPIGRPIANTTVYLLDPALRLLPVGVPGELFTGGDGLAIGYHASPELTAEKFIAHPEFGRLYRTGDRCRRLADGTIEFLGRLDQQVKVRGFRIEPGEIESLLAEHPDVRQAKVAVRGDTAETKRIIAWITAAPAKTPDATDLTAYLAKRLPPFMRPDSIGVIDAFPLSRNGKIRTSSLPDPSARAHESKPTSEAAPPRGETELHLAIIWKELLGLTAVDRNEDFFALGGHSLMALRMFSRINREFNTSLPLAVLLQHPTIASLAEVLKNAAKQPARETTPDRSDSGTIVTLSKGGSEPPLICIHGGDGGVLFYRGLAPLLPDSMGLHAIESLELGKSGNIKPATIEETTAAYIKNLLGIQPQGPYRLAGYSFGGVVAHEMACQLERLGHVVQFVGLFDTHNPASYSRQYGLLERLRVFWALNSGISFWKRLHTLRRRIGEGFRTNRRVKAELAAAAYAGPAEAYSDLRRIQVREENWRAMKAYKPGPFNGRLTLFKAIAMSDKIERPADYGWACNAISGLDIVPVPGEHLTLFAPEHIETLSKALTTALRKHSRSASGGIS